MDALLGALRQARLPFRQSTGGLALALLVVTAGVWIQHVVWERRVDHELYSSAARLPELLRAQSERTDLLVQAGLRAEGVLGALGQASNMDAALGLAEDESREHQLSEAHEILRSADLPGLKTRDALLIANAWGRVVLNLAAPEAFGAPAPAIPMLMEAMEGTPPMPSGRGRHWSGSGCRWWARRRWTICCSSPGGPWCRTVHRGCGAHRALGGHGLLDELGRAAGAEIVLHAPDGGWAGGRWPVAPPLRKVVQLQVGGTTIRVLGIHLGDEGAAPCRGGLCRPGPHCR
jgi:hypothetical protein